jgi:DNA-binding NarL/FixJ family response regulator
LLSDRPRVLLVDDNDAILTRSVAILRDSCAIVGTARDGTLGIAMAAALCPDVIVLDISMPGRSGLEVAAALRESGSSAAIVFVSAHDDAEFIEVARAAGGVGYVFKPRLSSDLPGAVRAASAGGSFFPSRS